MAKHKERPTPKVGSRFEKNFSGKSRTLYVVRHEDRICYKMDGEIYASPSAAAKMLTKSEVNGWKFWGMD
jgi:hypothetical protein